MREKVHRYLMQRPSGATPAELLDLVFTRPGADAELAPRFLRSLLGADGRFAWSEPTGRWIATAHAALAQPLDAATWVVVDLETTGGAPGRGHGIIEIGALKVAGGRVVDRFAQLVHPGRRLPPFITGLTGISDAMLAEQPRIDAVLPRFVGFAEGAVLVAHNASFDLGFLDAARLAVAGRAFDQPHACTLRLARRCCRSCGASRSTRSPATSASRWSTAIAPSATRRSRSRCCSDCWSSRSARGVRASPSCSTCSTAPPTGGASPTPCRARESRRCPARRGSIASATPTGVCSTSARRSTCASASAATSPIPPPTAARCSTSSAASTRSRSRWRDRSWRRRCARPTRSAAPSHPTTGSASTCRRSPSSSSPWATPTRAWRWWAASAGGVGRYFGPFRSRQSAVEAQALVARLFRLRTCTGRLAPDPEVSPCLQGQIGACTAPCAARVDRATYALQVAAAARFFDGECGAVEREIERRREAHSAAQRFEAAARAQRDLELVRRMRRRQRTMSWIVERQHFVAMQPAADGERALCYGVAHGRLVARAAAADGADLAAFAARVQAELSLPGRRAARARGGRRDHHPRRLVAQPRRGRRLRLPASRGGAGVGAMGRMGGRVAVHPVP
ncbi:MAG: exonuclease domain-containing protein [Candidatus Binatia bacterium]